MSNLNYITSSKQKKSKNRFWKMPFSMNGKSLYIILSFLLGISVVSYMIQANSLATKGYKIRELEQKISELNHISKDLEAKTLELQSFKNVSYKIDALKMEVAKKVEYFPSEPKVVSAQ